MNIKKSQYRATFKIDEEMMDQMNKAISDDINEWEFKLALKKFADEMDAQIIDQKIKWKFY